jgi:hypothetical protein
VSKFSGNSSATRRFDHNFHKSPRNIHPASTPDSIVTQLPTIMYNHNSGWNMRFDIVGAIYCWVTRRVIRGEACWVRCLLTSESVIHHYTLLHVAVHHFSIYVFNNRNNRKTCGPAAVPVPPPSLEGTYFLVPSCLTSNSSADVTELTTSIDTTAQLNSGPLAPLQNTKPSQLSPPPARTPTRRNRPRKVRITLGYRG